MRAIIEGKYLSSVKGTNKSGKPYVYSKLLVSDDVIIVFGFDGSDSLKEFEDVVLNVSITKSERGLNVRFEG